MKLDTPEAAERRNSYRPWVDWWRAEFYRKNPSHRGPIPSDFRGNRDDQFLWAWNLYVNDDIAPTPAPPLPTKCCMCSEPRTTYGLDHAGKTQGYCSWCLDVFADCVLLRVVQR